MQPVISDNKSYYQNVSRSSFPKQGATMTSDVLLETKTPRNTVDWKFGQSDFIEKLKPKPK